MRISLFAAALLLLAGPARSQEPTFQPAYLVPNPVQMAPAPSAAEQTMPKELNPIETMEVAYGMDATSFGPPALQDGNSPCLDGPTCYSRKYVQVDGLYWHRAGSSCSEVLAIDTNLGPDQPVLETRDLHFNGTGGARFLIGWNPDSCSRCSAWELSYFGLYGWQANANVSSDTGNSLTIPGALGASSNNFLNAGYIAAAYRSEFHNIEFNCVKTCCVCDATFDFLCGFRFMVLNESFSLTGDDSEDEGISSYDIDTNNYLYGLQLGGRYTRHYGKWSLQFLGKAGAFLNDASQSQQVLDSPIVDGIPFALRPRIGDRGAQVAALGEMGFTAIRPINDTWSFRIGYTALGLGGVALAPAQLDFTDIIDVSGSQLNSCGWVFLHGAQLGLEAKW